MNRLLDDVNLSEMAFLPERSAVEFRFLNMTDGGEVANLLCTGVMVFEYQADPNDELPHYVGEVNHAVVPLAEARELLRELGYGGNKSGDVQIPDCTAVHYINMYGWGSIQIVCTKAILTRLNAVFEPL